MTITSTTDLTVPSTLEIPNAFGHGTSTSVEIEQPVSTDLTISEKTTSDKELPETLSVEMETTASLIVDTPNLTVSLEGSYTTVEATTAENTLIVAKNTVIETLTVKKETSRSTEPSGRSSMKGRARSSAASTPRMRSNARSPTPAATIS